MSLGFITLYPFHFLPHLLSSLSAIAIILKLAFLIEFRAIFPRFPVPNSIVDLGEHIDNFLDTAHFIQNLDLVIGVDTSVIHLARAMGKPVWLLLSANSDWRWGLDQKDTIWCPTMQLFRQRQLSEWDDVFEKVKAELGETITSYAR